MRTPSERPPTWDDIEAVLYQEWVEEQVLLAVLEAMGELDEFDELDEAHEAGEAEEDDTPWAASSLDVFPLDERTWGEFSLNDLWVDDPSLRSA